MAFFTYIYKNFQLSNWSPLWPTLITYKVGETGLDVGPVPSLIFKFWPYQDLCNSCIKSEARTELSGPFYIYTKISSFQTGLLHGLHL